MRLLDERTKEYCEKHEFVKGIGECVIKVNRTVESCRYELFAKDVSGELVFQEYLVIQFRGGAVSCRNANINSNMANLREIGKLVDGGYYIEVDDWANVSKSWMPCLFNDDGSIDVVGWREGR